MAGLAISFGRRSFIRCFLETGVFGNVHSKRQSRALALFGLNVSGTWKHLPIEMALNLLVCGFCLFMFSWARYHKDLEQMLKNIGPLHDPVTSYKITHAALRDLLTSMCDFSVQCDRIGQRAYSPKYSSKCNGH